MTIVVKIGGAAIDDPGILESCAVAIEQLAQQSRVVVVHGGGKTLSRTLQQMGIESEFIDGLRVTNRETRDVALMVLAGLVNKRLVAALHASGVSALGLCGGDGQIFHARKKQFAGRDLGFVGEIGAVEVRWLEAIWDKGGVPVLASLALGEDGEFYNINADEMAASCAAACKAELLVFLTDVAGVKDASGKTIRSLTTGEIAELIAGSVITGGMLPKLRACVQALNSGVGQVLILAAAHAGVLQNLTDSMNEVTEVTCRGRSFETEGVNIEYTAAN